MLSALHHRPFNGIQQFIICLISRNIRIIGLDLVCASEKEARLAGLDHAQIVIGITAGNGLKSDGLQRLDCAELGLLCTHLEACDLAVVCYFQCVAE